jgi:membrane protein DedA with SNARE-associated domain
MYNVTYQDNIMLSALFIIPSFLTSTITAFMVGILIWYGLVNIPIALVSIIIGDILSFSFWYLLGRIGGRVFLSTIGKIFHMDQNTLNNFMEIFEKYKDIVSFFTSFFMGLIISILSLMNAGVIKVNFSKYMFANTLVGSIWIISVTICAYYLTMLFASVSGWVNLSLTIGLGVVVLVLFLTLGAWLKTLIIGAISRRV